MGKRIKFADVVQVGNEYGKLTVIAIGPTDRHGLTLVCECNCGHANCEKQTVKRANNVIKGLTKTCGARASLEKHGCATKRSPHNRTYRSWEHMIDRCYNDKHPHYDRYGKRGISVCSRWRESFTAFLEDMGDRPVGLTLEREDTNGNYEPSNCCWATYKEQNRNKTNGTELTHNGETMSVTEWAERLGVSRHALFGRLNTGWSVEKTLTTPVRLRRWGKKPKELT